MSVILVVDDEEFIRYMTEQMLQSLGYEVVLASDAQQAMAMLSGVDVMLSDITMPGKDGVALSKKVKDMRPDMKIFLMSGGFYSPSEKAELLKHCIDYMPKPFHMDGLRKMLLSHDVNP